MFGLFSKKSKLEKLELQYKKLLEEAFKLSTSNRQKSDEKTEEANKLLNEIELLRGKK